MKRYYLDTNALYAYYRNEMGSLLHHPNYKDDYAKLKGTPVVQALSEENTVFVSSLTCAEFIGRLLRHERGKEIKRKETQVLLEFLENDMGNRFQLVAVNDSMFRDAQDLMLEHARRHGCSLDTNDALHIAVAKSIRPPVILVTSDGGENPPTKMKCVCERIGLAWLDPEAENTGKRL